MYLKKQKLTEKTDAQYFGLRQKDYDFTFSACMEFDAEREMNRRGSSAIRIMQIIFRCASAVEKRRESCR